jgi:hypothetical protein
MRRTGRLIPLSLALLGLMGLAPTSLLGQSPAPIGGEPWIVTVSHWGKWPALAGTGALLAFAVVRNNEAKNAQSEFRGYCVEDISRCALVPGPDGPIYADPEAEELYQVYADLNRKARGFLAGGQVTLVFTATMFLIDLVYQRDGYDNIPFTPFELHATPRELGLSVSF